MKRPSKRKKTTLTIHESVLADFIQVCKQIGLRRDTYLNYVLPRAISLFEGSKKKNSPAAETMSKAFHKSEKGILKKFVVSLDSLVLKDLNALCVEKLVPRDIFVQEVLRYLTHTLSFSALHDPWSNCSDEDSSPFDHILVGDVPMKETLAVLEKAKRYNLDNNGINGMWYEDEYLPLGTITDTHKSAMLAGRGFLDVSTRKEDLGDCICGKPLNDGHDHYSHMSKGF